MNLLHPMDMDAKVGDAAMLGLVAAVAAMPDELVASLAAKGRPSNNPPEVDAVINAKIARHRAATISDNATARLAAAQSKRERKAAKRKPEVHP